MTHTHTHTHKRNKNRKGFICNKFSLGAPTPKRPYCWLGLVMSRARRRKGAGAKAPECAIVVGRWVRRQTRCLESSLLRRGLFVLLFLAQREPLRGNSCTHNEFPRESTDAGEFKYTGTTGKGSVCT